MMIRATLTIIALFLLQISSAQMINPVNGKWSITALGKGNYKLVYTAKIDKGWKVFSSSTSTNNNLGPILIDVSFDSTYVQSIGAFVEKGKKIVRYDSLFAINTVYYKDSFKVEQTIRVLKNTVLKGYLYFMACDQFRCIPPQDEEFSFEVKTAQSKGIYIEWDTSRSNIDPRQDGLSVIPDGSLCAHIVGFKQTLAIITERMGLCFLTSYAKLAA
ncbi:MAG: hypothetical protein JST49_15520 [Bacteroidetes bacterium]|nr:hypothetical protein [Bacteroidota bacterium]